MCTKINSKLNKKTKCERKNRDTAVRKTLQKKTSKSHKKNQYILIKNKTDDRFKEDNFNN